MSSVEERQVDSSLRDGENGNGNMSQKRSECGCGKDLVGDQATAAKLSRTREQCRRFSSTFFLLLFKMVVLKKYPGRLCAGLPAMFGQDLSLGLLQWFSPVMYLSN